MSDLRDGFPSLYAMLYPWIREIGLEHGYAVAIHGSLRRLSQRCWPRPSRTSWAPSWSVRPRHPRASRTGVSVMPIKAAEPLS